ncbi:MAG: hypothetical protein VYA96_03265, partial [Verrucomicrobiota bacterium]|nr:hypothetical protein [Verrucomicrobiota bacterium]
MKKSTIFSVLFFIITSISSFGQSFLDLNSRDPETRLWTGTIRTFDGTYTFGPNANLEGIRINGGGQKWEELNFEGANLKNAILSN